VNILTVEQKQLDLSKIDDVIPMTQYTVVDLGSDLNHHNSADIIFPKLIYIAEQTGAAVLCNIGGYEVMLPLSWNIFVGDEDSAEIELLPITELNARKFQALITNPISGFRHHFGDVRLMRVLIDYDWVMPKLKNGQALAVPINSKNECIYITSSLSKIPTVCSPSDFL
jgi:hypothetical protein